MFLRFPLSSPHRALLICMTLMSLVLSACGYKLAADTPSILGDGTKTLKVKEVVNPTLEAWLPATIRSALRDEINARHLAVWVDSGPADYEISIDIKGYTSHEWMSSRYDVSMLYDNTITLNATIYDGTTNTVVWRSGNISYSDRSEETSRENTTGDIVTQIMSRLAEKLRNTF